MEKLLIVDGNAIMHRAFHAIPSFVTKDGTPTNVVYGFFSMFHKAISDFEPTHIVVCFDTPKPTFRNKLFKEYQAQRPKIANEFISQIPFVKKALGEAGVFHIEKDGFEADDIIGTIAKKTCSSNHKVFILSGDRDIFQLIDDNTVVITPQTGLSNITVVTTQNVISKFNIPPEKIPDFKALVGDPSDNYFGAKGIGPKTAAKLINKYQTIEKLYENLSSLDEKTKKVLEDHKNDVKLGKKLATIDTDVSINFDIEKTKNEGFRKNLEEYLLSLEMYGLVKRIFGKKQANKKSSVKDKSKEKIIKDQISLF